MNCLSWDHDGLTKRLAQGVHFLLILPITASNVTRAGTNELHIVLPNETGIFVNAYVGQDKFICLRDDLASCARAVCGEIISPTHVVQVHSPELYIRNG